MSRQRDREEFCAIMAQEGISMTKQEIRRLFSRTFNGQPNFMTPDVVRYFTKGPYAVEVSKGRGIFTDTIYGVTVLELDGRRPAEDLSRGGFETEAEAMEYVGSLPQDGAAGQKWRGK